MRKNKLVYSFENTISSHPKHSKFFRNQEHKTTMNASDLIPIFIDEVLPGDTFKLTTKAIIRQTTLIKPVMDNSYIDISYYFVPNRLIWDDWKKFMGENTDGAWAVQTKPTIPQITAPNEGWEIGTIADYMGIPTGIKNLSVSALPIRAYTLIFNEWYRDQNLQQEAHLDKGSATKQGTNRNNYINDLECGGMPAKAGKYHDYFTSALPSPQKGQPISIPIGELAPVTTGKNRNEIPEEPMYIRGKKGSGLGTGTTTINMTSKDNIGILEQGNGITPPAGAAQIAPTNLYADLRKAQ